MAGLTAGHPIAVPPPQARWGRWPARVLTAAIVAFTVALGVWLAGAKPGGADGPAVPAGEAAPDSGIAPEAREDLPELLPRGRDAGGALRERLDDAGAEPHSGPAVVPEVRQHITGLRPRAVAPGADLRARIDRVTGDHP